MTKRLEELLNLPESKKIVKDDEKRQTKTDVAPLLRNISEYDKISAALPQVKGLGDIADTELDDLAKKATDAYDDLMDLGMNVEARYSARLFEVAGTMLKNAIDAKTHYPTDDCGACAWLKTLLRCRWRLSTDGQRVRSTHL